MKNQRKGSNFPEADELRRARSWSLKILGRRPRTESEMRDRLRRRGFSPAVVQQCLQWLCSSGALDDEEFAREYVRYTQRRNPMGRIRLRQQLQKRGGERELARRVAAEITPEREEELAGWALQRRGGLPPDDISREDRLRQLRRLHGYLARRGFPAGLIRRVLNLDALDGLR